MGCVPEERRNVKRGSLVRWQKDTFVPPSTAFAVCLGTKVRMKLSSVKQSSVVWFWLEITRHFHRQLGECNVQFVYVDARI